MNPLWLIVFPAVFGSVCGWHCWRKEHIPFRSAVGIGLGIAAAVFTVELALMVL